MFRDCKHGKVSIASHASCLLDCVSTTNDDSTLCFPWRLSLNNRPVTCHSPGKLVLAFK